MIDDVTAIVPSVASNQTETPSADLPPTSDPSLHSPSAEQASLSDRVFTTHDDAATLLGILTSAMLLRDVAVDTFDTSGEEDESQEKPDPDKKTDPNT